MINKSKKRLIVISAIIFFSLFGLAKSSLAAMYYIDFDSGSDSANGVSTSTPWKHSPGDSNATGNANITLQPDDTVMFKGGVTYRGSLVFDGRFVNGTAGHPITIEGTGWGTGKAIFDGSVPLNPTWHQCASQSACAGNPNWQSIYYSDVSAGYTFDHGFYENGQFMWYAQDPNPTDPFIYDKNTDMRVIPEGSSTVTQTRTTLTDPRYFTQSDADFWDGAYIITWVVPNDMSIKKITSYDPDTHTITYDDLGGDPYADRDSYYAILNHVSLMDTPGEYTLDEANNRIYVLPRTGNINSESFTVRSLVTAMNSDASYLNIDSFVIQKYVLGIRAFKGASITPQNVNITNNDLEDFKSGDWYAIQAGGNNMNVEGNTVTDCQRAVGILAGGNNVTVKNNEVNQTTRQGIWFMGAIDSAIEGNTVENCDGTHANGISVYSGSQNVTVSGNRVSNSNVAFTFDDSDSMDIFNNIFLGMGSGYVVADWEGMTGTVNFYNNDVLYSSDHTSTYLGPADQTATFNFKNNIVDGGGRDSRSNNIYLGLSWSQDPDYGWSLSSGEMEVADIDSIFVDPDNGDYHLKAGSPAINAGANVGVTTDIAGNSRPQGSTYDIGAYEYLSGADTTPPAAPSGLSIY